MAKVDAAKLKLIAQNYGLDEVRTAAVELESLRNKVGRMKITIKKKDHVIRTIDHHNNRLNNDNRACHSALKTLRDETERLRNIIKELSESALRISSDFEKQIESSNEDLSVMEKMLQQLRAKDDENKSLREALKFYADELNYEKKIVRKSMCTQIEPDEYAPAYIPHFDKGYKAREILEGGE